MKTEIENEYKKIIELLKKVNIKQYSDPEELDEASEVEAFLKELKPLIVDIVEFEKLLKKEIQSLPKEEKMENSSDSVEVAEETGKTLHEEFTKVFEDMPEIPDLPNLD